MLDAAVGHHLHDLHERHLDGLGVFEHRQVEGTLGELVSDDARSLFEGTTVKKAEPSAPERGTAALRSVDFYMLTSRYIF